MAEKTEKTDMGHVAQELIRYEQNEFPEIKAALKDRKSRRDNLRELAEKGTELPDSSTVFVALKKTNGRVNYKNVAEEVQEEFNVPREKYEAIVEKHRKPGSILKYDLRDKRKQFYQEDFDFFTPKADLVVD